MFNWHLKEEFQFYIETENSKRVPYSEWSNHKSEHLSQISILQELVDNGLATVMDNAVAVDIEDVLLLDVIDKKLLELPTDYPFVIYIEPDGTLNQNTFKFRYGFYDFAPNGTSLLFVRNGPLLKRENAEYLLTINQFKVLEEIDRFNALPKTNKTYNNNLTSFSDIKEFSDDVATLLDSFLKSQTVLHPDKIQVDVSFNDNTLELKPKIDSLQQESLERAFDVSSIVKEIYSVKDENGGTTRLVVDKQQRKALEVIKKNRNLKDKEKINDIVQHPELYFDDLVIDLSFFSKRVREIGVYKPKFYPFVSPYKSEWIPGFTITDPVNGSNKIYFKTQEELAGFSKERSDAIRDGKDHFFYKEIKVNTADAEIIIEAAQRQFETPKEPITTIRVTPVDPDSTDQEQTLIVKENANLLEHVEEYENLDSLALTFHSIPNLASNIHLKSHQRNGVAWLQSLFNKQFSGCLLADDMGLGKTIQLLYFLEWHTQNVDSDKPYLVVAPVSLLENWEREYKKFFQPTNLNIRLVYGSSGISRTFSSNDIFELQHKQIILTNYESLRIYQLNLCAVDYAIVVLDEAQKIKTPGTRITNVSKALKADFKVAMTGTPVENTLVDLWCIMDFSVPGLLGNAKDFAKVYQRPLSNEETDVHELGKELRNQIGVFMNRRLKRDVANDLPKKIIKLRKQEMPDVQANRYINEIELTSKQDIDGAQGRNHILKLLWTIRDISDHPYLGENLITKFRAEELIKSSAKLQVTIDDLKKIREKEEKAIIFADKRNTQQMLQKVVHEIFNIPPPSIINGDTPSTSQKITSSKLSRQQTIDRFQSKEGFNVIIMSPLAAGVGLNVAGANHVIHYSRHWNPAKEEQATDRAYRIGQMKDVTVYYPMAIFPDKYQSENGEKLNSFDEVLNDLLSRKKALATSTLFPTEQSEVRPDDLFSSVFQNAKATSDGNALTINDLETLTPRLFEAYVAALYSKQGFHVQLTPNSNDKGTDVIAFDNKVNLLIQAKQSQKIVSNNAVQEIVTSKLYYSGKYDEDFNLVVLSNNYFGRSSLTLAEANDVQLIDLSKLKNLVQEFPVTMADIRKQESMRLTRI